MGKQTTFSPLLALVLGVLGFTFAVLVLTVGSVRTQRSADFIRTPYFLAWLIMNGIQGGFWVVVIVPLVRWLGQLRNGWRKRQRDVVLGLVLLLAVVLIADYFFAEFYHPKDLPLYNHMTRITILNLAGSPLAVVAILGIWLVQGELEVELSAPKLTFQHAEKLIMLRRQAMLFLTIAGFIIGTSTLSFGVMRNAVMLVEPARKDFPPISVVVWGVFYSSILALAYAPTYLAFADAESRIEHDIAPVPPDTEGDPAEWLKEKNSLQEHLSTGGTGWAQFQSVFSIFAPLMGSVIPVLMGF